MTRRQAQARALIWSLVVVGGVLLVISLAPVDATWTGTEAGAGQATTSSTPSPTPTPTPTPTPAPTPPPTPAPTPAPTLGPPITVGPPVTLAPGPTYEAPTSSADEGTTTSSTTTTLPELLVPAPPDRPVETSTTVAPVEEDEGLSSSTKLGLAVGGLLTSAVAIAALTVVYFLKTRPGADLTDADPSEDQSSGEEVTDDALSSWEPSSTGAEVGAGAPSETGTGGVAALAALLAEDEEGEPGDGAGPGAGPLPEGGAPDAGS